MVFLDLLKYLKTYYGQNNLFIVKSILKIIVHVLRILLQNFECFVSKPNAHGTFSNFHIKISPSLWNKS